MLIAFSFLNFEESGKHENFLITVFQKISASHSEHTFLFISDKNFDSASFSKNVIPVVIDLKSQKPIKWLIWYHIKIQKILRKYKADILIAERFCSLITNVPQILVSPDLSFLHQPSFVNKRERLFFKKLNPRFLKKAKIIIALSQFEKSTIIKHYKTNADKIEVIHEGVDKNFEPMNFEERENIKEQYADGNEYFIYSGIISPQKNLKNLLKGFSALKKRQRSSMQLIIAGNPGKQFEEFEQSLELYKFKKEIKLLNSLSEPEIIKITASSYAMINASEYEVSARSLLNAMKCEVPVLISEAGVNRELCGEAALYFDPENYKDIAEKMMEIFKDEKLRKELIEKGKLQLQKYNWEKSAEEFMQIIDKTARIK